MRHSSLIGWALSNLLWVIGVSEISRDVVEAVWLAMVAIATIVLIWHRLHRTDGPPLSRLVAVMLTVAIVAAWIFEAMSMTAAFWTLVVVTILPLLMSAIRDAVHNVAGLDDALASRTRRKIGWIVVIERVDPGRAGRRSARSWSPGLARRSRRDRHGRDGAHRDPSAAACGSSSSSSSPTSSGASSRR